MGGCAANYTIGMLISFGVSQKIPSGVDMVKLASLPEISNSIRLSPGLNRLMQRCEARQTMIDCTFIILEKYYCPFPDRNWPNKLCLHRIPILQL